MSIVIAVVALAGALLLLYPSAAAWLTQYQQSREIGSYSERVRDLGAETRAAELRDAARYNAGLVDGSSVIAAGERKPLAGEAVDVHSAYGKMLAADEQGLMARIKIPVINADLPIYHGTTDAVLERGVGHLEGSALPVGGESTHAVLTGHSGLASAELFTNLNRVRVGDTFTIEVFGEVLTYQVRDTRVVEPDETETLYPQRGEDLVTLVTCTPLGINSHRILVTGERILPTPARDLDAAGATPDVPGFPWWAVVLGGVVLSLGGYIFLAGRPARRGSQRAATERRAVPASSISAADRL